MCLLCVLTCILVKLTFQNIVYKLKDLQDVELVECTMLQNEGITSLGENCLKCQRVNLRGNDA